MTKRGDISPSNVTMLPWKLEVEFDDTLSYMRTFIKQEENDKFTAPPTSPVGSFKYAPLVKFRKYSSFIPSQDIGNLFPLYDNSNVKKSNLVESCIYIKNPINDDKVAILGTQSTSPLGYTKHRKKEKLGFIEGSCVTKSYSEESIFLEDRIVDVNEDKKSRIQCNSSLERLSEKNESRKGSVNSRISLNFPRRKKMNEINEQDEQENKFEEFSLSNIVDKESKRHVDLRPSLYTIYKPCKRNSRNMLAEVNEMQLVTQKNNSLDKEKLIETKLWKYALLANRSSNNFYSNNSMFQNDIANYTRYRPEKYTFLRKRNSLKDYKRTVRLRSTANLLDFGNRWIKKSSQSVCKTCTQG